MASATARPERAAIDSDRFGWLAGVVERAQRQVSEMSPVSRMLARQKFGLPMEADDA